MTTLAQLKAEAKTLGMTVRKKDGEYRVSWPHDEASAYYTDDADDALGTMRIMHRDKDDKHVLMSIQGDGSIIGYLVSTGSGRRAIHATRDGAITFQNRGRAELYNREEHGGRLTPVRVADLPDPAGPNVLRKNPTKRGFKVADAQGNRWRVYLVNDKGEKVFIAKGARKTSFAWTKPTRAKLFVTKGEARRYLSDYVAHYFPKYETGVEPVAYGPTLGEVLAMKKNPGKKKPAFGRKGVAKKRAAPTRDYRVKRTAFSRREAIMAMKKNPSLGSRVSRFVVRAVKTDGDVMYFDGCHFKGDKKKAAIFSGKAGEAVMEKIERDHAATLKRGGVKYLDVVQA